MIQGQQDREMPREYLLADFDRLAVDHRRQGHERKEKAREQARKLIQTFSQSYLGQNTLQSQTK